MERIILEVDNATARAWRNMAPATRAKYEKKITDILKDLKEAEFDLLLNEAGNVAMRNGLTEEKLNALLNEEDQVFQIILSDATSNEFTNAFTRAKFDKYLSFEIRLKIIDDFKSLAIVTNPTVCIFDCRDPKDNKFLELAISESVECIITGDQDLLVMNPFKGIPILNASDFLRTYGKEATFMLNEPNEEYKTQQDHVLE